MARVERVHLNAIICLQSPWTWLRLSRSSPPWPEIKPPSMLGAWQWPETNMAKSDKPDNSLRMPPCLAPSIPQPRVRDNDINLVSDESDIHFRDKNLDIVWYFLFQRERERDRLGSGNCWWLEDRSTCGVAWELLFNVRHCASGILCVTWRTSTKLVYRPFRAARAMHGTMGVIKRVVQLLSFRPALQKRVKADSHRGEQLSRPRKQPQLGAFKLWMLVIISPSPFEALHQIFHYLHLQRPSSTLKRTLTLNPSIQDRYQHVKLSVPGHHGHQLVYGNAIVLIFVFSKLDTFCLLIKTRIFFLTLITQQ